MSIKWRKSIGSSFAAVVLWLFCISDAAAFDQVVENQHQWLLEFAMEAYNQTPTIYSRGVTFSRYYDQLNVGVYLSYPNQINGKYVCVVAWRGTNDLADLWADLRSQLSWYSTPIQNDYGVDMKGGKGFVDRVNDHKAAIDSWLNGWWCEDIAVTGHSLGGANSQVHGLQIYWSDYWGKLKQVVAWNSPNAVDDWTNRVHGYFMRNDSDIDLGIYNRRRDAIVNSVPTGLHRIGNPDSSPLKGNTGIGVDRVASDKRFYSWEYWYTIGHYNHNPDLWEGEF